MLCQQMFDEPWSVVVMRFVASACVLCLFGACGGDGGAAAEEPLAANDRAEVPAAPHAAPEEEPLAVEPSTEADAPSGPSARDETYVAHAIPVEAGYAAGSLSTFAVSIESQGEWHLNELFPFSLAVEGEGLNFPKDTLAQSDAAEWSEESARFDIPFTPAAGAHEVRATVRFAMCNPTSCVPKTAQLALNLAAR
jgi:hypothetical protein